MGEVLNPLPAAVDAEWCPLALQVPPSFNAEAVTLPSTSRAGLGTYDYSKCIPLEQTMQGDEHLRRVVEEMMKTIHPPQHMHIEYRVVAGDGIHGIHTDLLPDNEPAQRHGARQMYVEEARDLRQELSERCTLPGEQLAGFGLLRKRQMAGLSFMMRMQHSESVLRSILRAHVSLPPVWYEPAVGDQVMLRGSSLPEKCFAEKSPPFRDLTLDETAALLKSPCRVTRLIRRRNTVVAEVEWNLTPHRVISRRIFLAECQIHSAPGAIARGSHVVLKREDTKKNIPSNLVGVVRELVTDGDTTMARVMFPTYLNWTGSVNLLELCEAPFRQNLVLRVHLTYQVRGCVLAFDVGWGKTAPTLALLKFQYQQAISAGRAYSALIIVPTLLHAQWVNEMKSWLGMREISAWWLSDGRVSVWAPSDYRHPRPQEAHITLLPFGLLLSQQYRADSSRFNLREKLWDTLVIDEADSLCGKKFEREDGRFLQRELIRLRRKSTYLMASTLPFGDGSRGAAVLAMLMGASLCTMAHPHFQHDRDPLLHQAADSFLTLFARTGEGRKTSLQEHVMPVTLSAAEKVLYTNVEGFVGHAGSRRAGLMELCLGFGEKGLSAGKRLALLVKQKRAEKDSWLQETKSGLAGTLLVFRFLHKLVQRPVEGGQQVLDHLLETKKLGLAGVLMLLRLSENCDMCDMCDGEPQVAHGRSFDAQLARLFVPREEADHREDCWKRGKEAAMALYRVLCEMRCAELLRIVFPQMDDDGWRQACESWTSEAEHPVGQELRDKSVQLIHLKDQFVDAGRTLQALEHLENSLGRVGECPICMDQEKEAGDLNCILETCQHNFHLACLQKCLREQPNKCPVCRGPARLEDALTVKEKDPWQGYDQKIKAIIETLRRIKAEYPGDRAIVFVQDRKLRRNLAAALRHFKVECLTVEGSATGQASIITRWQARQDSTDFAMVLSVNEHKRGIALTAANHIVFAHPVCAPSATEAAHLEKQALGRIRGIGQMAKILHVWHVYIKGTVEEDMFRARLPLEVGESENTAGERAGEVRAAEPGACSLTNKKARRA